MMHLSISRPAYVLCQKLPSNCNTASGVSKFAAANVLVCVSMAYVNLLYYIILYINKNDNVTSCYILSYKSALALFSVWAGLLMRI